MALRIIVALFVSGLFAACNSRPSESLAEAMVASRLDGGQTQRVRLADFTKIDGQSAEMFGIKMYEMNFTAVVEFTDDAYYTTGGSIMQPDVKIETRPTSQPPQTCGQNLAACFSQTPMLARKGDRLRLAGSARFEKSESGWKPAGLSVSLPNGAEIPGRRDELVAAAPTASSRLDFSDEAGELCAGAMSGDAIRIDQGGADSFVGDAYHREGAPAAAELSFGGWGDHYYDYLKFDLSSRPALKKGWLQRTVLCLFATKVAPNDPQLQVAPITSSWDRLAIGALPAYGAAVPFGRVQEGWNAVDVSEMASSWMTGDTPNHGLVLIPKANNQTNGAFASAEAEDGSKRPRLVFPQ